jgi:hypothetical protein
MQVISPQPRLAHSALEHQRRSAFLIRRASRASQFPNPLGRRCGTKARGKARLHGNEDSDEQDLLPKPKGMRSAVYNRRVAKYDAAEEGLDTQLVWLLHG